MQSHLLVLWNYFYRIIMYNDQHRYWHFVIDFWYCSYSKTSEPQGMAIAGIVLGIISIVITIILIVVGVTVISTPGWDTMLNEL